MFKSMSRVFDKEIILISCDSNRKYPFYKKKDVFLS